MSHSHKVCDYLNQDKAFHKHMNWQIDPGKLTAAFESAGYDLSAILTVFSRPGEPIFVELCDLTTGPEIDRNDFLSLRPTKIGRVGHFDFYEEPKYGDEVPLIVDDGQSCGTSHYYDLPVVSELLR